MGTLDEFSPILSSVIACLPQAVIVVDSDSRVHYANKAATEMFGYDAGDMEGRPLDRLLPVRFANRHRQYVRDFIVQNETSRQMGEHLRIFGRRQSGAEFPAEATISHLNLPHGEPMALVLMSDISHRVPDPAFIDKYLETTAASSETIAALDSLEDCVLVLDRELTVLFVNRAALSVTSRAKQELLGRTVVEVFPTMAGSRLHKEMLKSLQAQAKRSTEFHHKRIGKWFRVNLIPSPSTLVVQCVDNTQVKLMQATNARLTETLNQALDSGPDRKNYRGKIL